MPVIPTFQRQQQAPQSTGVAGLPNVQRTNLLNQAISAGGAQLEAVGTEVIKAQADSELSTADVGAQLKLAALEAELATEDGLMSIVGFETKSQAIYNDLVGTIMTKDARVAFDNRWKTLKATSQIRSKAAGLKRKLEGLRGDLTVNIDSLARGVDHNGGGAVSRSAAKEAAETAINAAVKGKVITPDAGAKLKIKFGKTMAQGAFDNLMRGMSIEDLDKLDDRMTANKFDNSELEDLWGLLDGKEKGVIQRHVRTAQEKRLNIAEKEERHFVARLKRNQAKAYAGFMKRIIAGRRDAKGANPPTKTQLLDAVETLSISSKDFELLEKALDDTDPIQDDPDVVKGFLSKIRGAKNKVELEAVITSAENSIGKNGTISFETFEKIEGRARAAMDNTPLQKRIKIYGNALKRTLGATDFLDKILPGVKDRAAAVELDFEARVLDGVDPAEAFEDALESFRTRGKISLNSIPRPKFGPDKPLNQWTLEEVESARFDTKTHFSGKANTLATQLLILSSLSSYLKQAEDAAASVEGGKTLGDKLEELRER